MPTPAISKQQVLAVLTAATSTHKGSGSGEGQDQDGLAGLSMDELATQAGVSRATLYRLFGNQQHLLHELGLQPPPTVRSRILDTALELVGRHGLAELSMDDLAAQAGISRATLYRLVPGKEALFAELVRSFSPFEPIVAVLEAAGDRPPAEVIPAIAQAMAAAMDGHIGLLLQLLFEFARPPDPDSGQRISEDAIQGMRTLPLVSRYLADQMAAGRLRQMDPDLAFQALVGPIVLHVLWRPAAGSRTDGPPVGGAPLEEAVDELVGVWLRAMATDLPTGPQPAASRPPRPRRRRDDRPDLDQPPRGRP
jgi:AcrR family transcriptional regulator